MPPAAASGPLDRRHRLVIFRVVARHRVRVVRFLHLRDAGRLFRELFFPLGNETAGFLSSLALFGVGFSVRPFGALVFGRIGVGGRKYTFLSRSRDGIVDGARRRAADVRKDRILAPILLVLLRLAQGLALGGEYGGAATYVAEHAPAGKRGAYTSWIQTTATLGFFLSLAVILGIRSAMSPASFAAWGWRIPFSLCRVAGRLGLHPAQAP